MTGMKYICFDNSGIEEVVLFPCWQKHDAVASMFCLHTNHIISAGFIKRAKDDGRLYCYGRSIGLGVGSRPVEDLDLILRQLEFES